MWGNLISALWRIGVTAALLLIAAGPGHAQDEVDSEGWSYTGKVTAVWAAGNSQSSTFGIGSTVRKEGGRNQLQFEASAVRTESGIRTRRAVGTSSSYRVEETTEHEKTAENYRLRGRYDWKASNRVVFFIGADWLRNTFSGIDSRMLIATGAGNVWADRDDFRFKTDYGVTYTFQDDVVQDPFLKSNFPGVRFSWDLLRKLTSTTRFESVLVMDANLDETDDIRLDFTNGVSVAVSSSIALNPSLQLLWRNDPSLASIDLVSDAGVPTGETVLEPLQKLDSLFTMALVVTL